MKIEPTFPTATREDFRPIRPQSSQAWPAFERSRSHGFELAATPDVRADVVARGKALIANPNYPSKEQIKQIARVLVASGFGR